MRKCLVPPSARSPEAVHDQHVLLHQATPSRTRRRPRECRDAGRRRTRLLGETQLTRWRRIAPLNREIATRAELRLRTSCKMILRLFERGLDGVLFRDGSRTNASAAGARCLDVRLHGSRVAANDAPTRSRHPGAGIVLRKPAKRDDGHVRRDGRARRICASSSRIELVVDLVGEDDHGCCAVPVRRLLPACAREQTAPVGIVGIDQHNAARTRATSVARR